MYLTILAIIWTGLGLIGTGIEFAYYQNQFSSIAKSHYKEDLLGAYTMSLFGPINVILCLFLYGTKYGFKYR